MGFNLKHGVCAILLISILFIGCEANVVSKQTGASEASNNDSVSKNISIPDSNVVSSRPKQSQSLPKDAKAASDKNPAIDLENLQDAINNITKNTYLFKQDPSYPDYIRSSELKYFIIHTSSKKSDTPEKFCENYCANGWDGWKYYTNVSWINSFIPMMTRENFTNEYEYIKYLSDRSMMTKKIIERPYEVENGKVLEYQYLAWQTNQFGRYEGAWQTLLLYKVYCSPNITVLLRPKWDDFLVSFPVADIEDVTKTWESYIIPFRKDVLDWANELLARCNVDRDFFGDFELPSYYHEEELVYHWRPYYKFQANVSRMLDIEAVKKGNDEYEIVNINATFTNNDDFNFAEELTLRIKINMDNSKEDIYYENNIASSFAPGRTISKKIARKDYTFRRNLTAEVTLYTTNQKGEIRPYVAVYTADDFDKGDTLKRI